MKITRGEKIFNITNNTILLVASLSCLLPLIHTLAMSLSSPSAIDSGFVGLWPVEFSLNAYKTLFTHTTVLTNFKNSTVITVVGVLLSMVFTILCAYPLSRGYFVGRRFFSLAILFTIVFNGGVIPTYLVVKNLHLIDTYWAIWLPGIQGGLMGVINVFNMLVLKTFIENIPSEIEESAKMDGCSEWRYLLSHVLPLSMPIIAVLSLFYAVSYWNNFMNVLIYMNSPDKQNLAVMLQQMISSQRLETALQATSPEELMLITPESLKSATIMVMVLPMVVVYPFVQKHFTKGIMLGAIKG
ncbi:carbohydrate ABC transporter permease [Paenibacillus sp. LjRoot153]|uniref:carbohydrate ABC transporter permease n=1 Tax=unclassified Paenibacillus TaxID=185978 RepID=UPI0007104AE5|nr:carbohydrate ABC transporter permease [Paenibacillus sp. Soil766]KRF09744.1 ABC transporter permease [Paenibacillus sp. Soil766]